MSLWGATVITNLMSAIPWVGQDIVESTNIVENYVFIENTACILPTIGIINNNALKNVDRKIRLDKKQYLSVPSSFIYFLVGFIDGDGYIQITETTKGFITIKLVISLHLSDISILEYIRSVLKLGKIKIYKDARSPTCKLIINKTDLQEVLFPLFLYHNIFFLTETRINQFNLTLHVFKQNIIKFNEIPVKKNIPTSYNLPTTALDYTKLHFFQNWIVGFTMAEGSFFMKNNNDGCFQLKQRVHTILFESFKLVFETGRKIEITKGLYNQFGISHENDIQKVINFFSFSGLHPLVGLKYIQYLKWLNSLSNSLRYKHLNFPNNTR